MSTNELPNWVRKNPEKHLKRLHHEAGELYKNFPNLGIFPKGDSIYIEGPVVSSSMNAYIIRVLYGSNYPYEPPSAFVVDRDVISYAKTKGMHQMHNYGETEGWGLRLCLQDGQEWQLRDSGVSIVLYAIAWVNAYEFFRVKGYWPLKQ